MVETKQVANNNRASVISQLAKGNAEKALQLEKLSNEQLATELSNQKSGNAAPSTDQNNYVNNSFWSNMLNSFKPQEKLNSGTLLFDFNKNNQDNFFNQGLTIEKSEGNTVQNCSAQVNSTVNKAQGAELEADIDAMATPEGKSGKSLDKTALKKVSRRLSELGADSKEAKELLDKIKTEDDLKLITTVLEAKDKDGNFILKNHFDLILSAPQLESIDSKLASKFVDKLLACESNGNPPEQLANILDIMDALKNEEDVTIVSTLLDAKDEQGKARFPLESIGAIVTKRKDGGTITPEILDALIKCENKDGTFPNIADIVTITEKTKTQDDLEKLNKMLDAKTQDGKQRFELSNIRAIMWNDNSSTKSGKALDGLINYKSTNGKVLSAKEIELAMIRIKKEEDLTVYSKMFEAMHQYKDSAGNALSGKQIESIINKFPPSGNMTQVVNKFLALNNPEKKTDSGTKLESAAPRTNEHLKNIETGMELLDDPKVKQKAKTMIEDIIKTEIGSDDFNWDRFEKKLKEVNNMVSAYNTTTGKKPCIDCELDESNPNKSEISQYYNYLKKQDPQKAAILLERTKAAYSKQKLSKTPLDWKKVDDAVVKDFIKELKFEKLVDYTENTTDKEMSDYMYEKCYLSTLSPEVSAKCKKIMQEFGTKIYLSSEGDTNAGLDLISKELTEWKEESGGKATMPKVLDLNKIKKRYKDNSSAYGQSAAAGYANQENKTISINGGNHNMLEWTLRHEIMHLNDSRTAESSGLKFDEIMPKKTEKINGKDVEVPDMEKCKYTEEFLNAGISPEHISYAYNNPAEFIAVASEGDSSKYSPEFKKLLVKMGYPEWGFDLKVTRESVKNQVNKVETIKNKYPDIVTLGDYTLYEFAENVQKNLGLADAKTVYDRALAYVKKGMDPYDAACKVQKEIYAEPNKKMLASK